MASETLVGAGLVSEGATAGLSALSAAGTGVKLFVLANPITMTALGGVLVGAAGYYGYNRWRNRSDNNASEAEIEADAPEETAEPAAA